jgi:hypothetical protein
VSLLTGIALKFLYHSALSIQDHLENGIYEGDLPIGSVEGFGCWVLGFGLLASQRSPGLID